MIKWKPMTYKCRVEPTPKGLEYIVKRVLLKEGMFVFRTDLQNYMPDFCVWKNRKIGYFVECKRYASVDSLDYAMYSWENRQSKQFYNFCKMAEQKIPIHMCIYIGSDNLIYKGDVTKYLVKRKGEIDGEHASSKASN